MNMKNSSICLKCITIQNGLLHDWPKYASFHCSVMIRCWKSAFVNCNFLNVAAFVSCLYLERKIIKNHAPFGMRSKMMNPRFLSWNRHKKPKDMAYLWWNISRSFLFWSNRAVLIHFSIIIGRSVNASMVCILVYCAEESILHHVILNLKWHLVCLWISYH